MTAPDPSAPAIPLSAFEQAARNVAHSHSMRSDPMHWYLDVARACHALLTRGAGTKVDPQTYQVLVVPDPKNASLDKWQTVSKEQYDIAGTLNAMRRIEPQETDGEELYEDTTPAAPAVSPDDLPRCGTCGGVIEPDPMLGSKCACSPIVPVVSLSDLTTIIAGIRQFGLAADGSDLRDLESSLAAAREVADEILSYAGMEKWLARPGGKDDVWGIRKGQLLRLRSTLAASKKG